MDSKIEDNVVKSLEKLAQREPLPSSEVPECYGDVQMAKRNLWKHPLEINFPFNPQEPTIEMRKAAKVVTEDVSGKWMQYMELRDADIPALLEAIRKLFPDRMTKAAEDEL